MARSAVGRCLQTSACPKAVMPSKATTPAGAASAFGTNHGVMHAAFHSHHGRR